MGARSKKTKQPRGGVAPSWRKANIQVHKEHSYQLGEEWQRFFKLLLRYRQAHGTFAVGDVGGEFAGLGAWARRQRRQRDRGALSLPARARLEGCGFLRPGGGGGDEEAPPAAAAGPEAASSPSKQRGARPPTCGTALRLERLARVTAGEERARRRGDAADVRFGTADFAAPKRGSRRASREARTPRASRESGEHPREPGDRPSQRLSRESGDRPSRRLSRESGDSRPSTTRFENDMPADSRPSTRFEGDARPGRSSRGDAVPDSRPSTRVEGDAGAASRPPTGVDSRPSTTRPKSVRFDVRTKVSEASEASAGAVARACAWCGGADDVRELVGTRLCAACARAATPAVKQSAASLALTEATAAHVEVPEDSIAGHSASCAFAIRPLGTVKLPTIGPRVSGPPRPEPFRIETPSKIRRLRSRRRRRKAEAAARAEAAEDAARAEAAALAAAPVRERTPPPVRSVLARFARDGVLTLLQIQTHLSGPRRDLVHWLCDDKLANLRKHADYRDGAVKLDDLERAVDHFDQEQKKAALNARAAKALEALWGVGDAAGDDAGDKWVREARHGWRQAAQGAKVRSWTPRRDRALAVDGLVHHDEQADALDHSLSEATLADGKIRARGRRETRLF